MKKPLFSLICAFALLFSGCSKEETAAPKDEKLYAVTFNVSTFSKEIVPMASLKTARQMNASTTSGGALSDAVRYITYAVYNESGIKVNEKTSHSTSPSFGKIEDSLPKGKYKVVVSGATEGLGSIPDHYGYPMYISGHGDIFLKEIELVVAGEPLAQTVILERVVGKVEIHLTDDIPESIQEIIYSIQGIGYYYYLGGGGSSSGQSVSKSNYYWDFTEDPMGPDYTQELGLYFFLPYQDAVTSVNIRAYNRNRNLVVDKTINDVPVAINKKTILTGRLFDDAGSTKGQAFSVSIDDKWNSEVNHVGF